MIGLIQKDIFVCKKSLRTIAILILVFAAMGMISDDNSLIMFITGMYFPMLVMTSFAYDHQAKWDAYGMTMPVSRSETVLAKYLLGLLLSLVGGVISLLLSAAVKLYRHSALEATDVISQLVVLGVSLVILSILIPLIYRFGVEKARIFMIAIFLVPTIGVLLFSKLSLPPVNEQIINTLVVMSPFLVILIGVISYFISARVFEKKEL